MKYDPKTHHRKSIRLKGYDYSQAGLYFVTICTQNREYLFGEIIDGKMILNDAGIMIQSEWLELPKRYQQIDLNEYVIMPNHFHAIFTIGNLLSVGEPLVGTRSNGQYTDGQRTQGQPQGISPTTITPTVGNIIGAFKSISTNQYIRGVENKNWQRFDKKLWQRNYWEHVTRNEEEHIQIAEYINHNPEKWDEDTLNKNVGAPLVGARSENLYSKGQPQGIVPTEDRPKV